MRPALFCVVFVAAVAYPFGECVPNEPSRMDLEDMIPTMNFVTTGDLRMELKDMTPTINFVTTGAPISELKDTTLTMDFLTGGTPRMELSGMTQTMDFLTRGTPRMEELRDITLTMDFVTSGTPRMELNGMTQTMDFVSSWPPRRELKDMVLTVEKLDNITKIILKHEDKIPKLMLEQIKNATEEEKEEFVNFVNKVREGNLTITAKNTEELVKFIEENAPLVGKKARILHEDHESRVANLTQQGQEFVKKWEAKWFENWETMRTDKAGFFKKMGKMVPEYFEDLKKLSEETWKSFEEQFPEQMNFWKDNKERLEKFKEALRSMTQEEMEKLNKFIEAIRRARPEIREKLKDAMKSIELRESAKKAFDKFSSLGLDKLLPPGALQQ